MPNDAYDPINALRKAHDKSLNDLKEEMLEAINNRKKAVLPTAIAIFNKLQDKHVKSLTLEDYDAKDESIDEETGFTRQTDQISDINQSINKLAVLIEDQSSPILSAVSASEKYESAKLPQTLAEYNQRHSNPVDVAEMMRDARKLSNLNDELDQIAQFTDQVDLQMQQRLAQAKRHTQAQVYLEHTAKNEKIMEEQRKASLKKAYDDYLARKDPANDPSNVSMDTKVHLMRSLLSI